MSQAKVDRYKENKANRKQIMKKEKREQLAWKIGGYAVVLVLVGWIGVSAYGRFTQSSTTTVQSYVLDASAVEDYLSTLEEE